MIFLNYNHFLFISLWSLLLSNIHYKISHFTHFINWTEIFNLGILLVDWLVLKVFSGWTFMQTLCLLSHFRNSWEATNFNVCFCHSLLYRKSSQALCSRKNYTGGFFWFCLLFSSLLFTVAVGLYAGDCATTGWNNYIMELTTPQEAGCLLGIKAEFGHWIPSPLGLTKLPSKDKFPHLIFSIPVLSNSPQEALHALLDSTF